MGRFESQPKPPRQAIDTRQTAGFVFIRTGSYMSLSKVPLHAYHPCNFRHPMTSFDWPTYLQSLEGGALIGLAAAVFLLLDGRVAGVSGIISGALARIDQNQLRNAAFVIGLVLGPVAYRLAFGAWPMVRIEASWGVLAIAGLLVGFGTRLGSGCTSGHGVCGMARLSRRSIAAVAVFLSTGILTVAAMNLWGVP